MHDQIAMGRRIRTARESLGCTQSGISELCGSKLRSWQEYEKGSRSPGSQVIAGLVSLGINANWILNGTGQMLTSADKQVRETPKAYLPASDDYAYVPKLLDLHVSAGDGAEATDGNGYEELAFRRQWLTDEGLSVRNLRLVTSRGDSMTPTIPEGATLLVDISHNEFLREGIYVIRLDDHLYAKRLQRGPGGALLVISDNPLYKQIIVEPSQQHITIVGKVVWLGHTM